MPVEVNPPPSLPGARLLFSLDPTVSHLNHGAFGAVPVGVQRAQQRLRDEMDANPVRFFTRGLADRVTHARQHLATFLEADPDATALVPNTTTGIGVILHTLRLNAGDEVVTTAHGYGAVALAVARDAARSGVRSRVVSLPPRATDDEIVAAISAALRPPRTRLLIVDLITSPTARLLPVEAILAKAHEQGVPVCVDAAHAPGMLPVRVSALGADFWVGNLHKWTFAPRGTAVLCVAPAWRSRIEPLVVSWEQPAGFPRSVEFQGTTDPTAWLAAPTGLFTLRSIGVPAVRRHNSALAEYGQRVVGTALGLSPADLPQPGGPRTASGPARSGPPDGPRSVAARPTTAHAVDAAGTADAAHVVDAAHAVSMRIVPLPEALGGTSEGAAALRGAISDRLRAEVSVSTCQGRSYLRLSAQIYNRAEEYERLAAGLPEVLADRIPRP